MTEVVQLIDCAKHYGDLPHQNDALTWLQSQMTSDQMWTFARAYRNNNDGSPISLVNVMRYYSGLDHQTEAIKALQEDLDDKILVEFTKKWRTKPPESVNLNVLNLSVPWDSQMNSRYPSQAARMCFSSSVWMIGVYRSKSFKNRFPTDDDYLRFLLNSYGDTTDAEAHIRALSDLGLKPVYRQDFNLARAIDLIRIDRPLAIGFLHRGSHDHPSGGGHWAVIRGFNLDQGLFNVNDPFGSVMDSPPYSGAVSNGNNALYPRWVLNNRWTVERPGIDSKDGWGLYLE